jgi:hypothetical protein
MSVITATESAWALRDLLDGSEANGAPYTVLSAAVVVGEVGFDAVGGKELHQPVVGEGAEKVGSAGGGGQDTRDGNEHQHKDPPNATAGGEGGVFANPVHKAAVSARRQGSELPPVEAGSAVGGHDHELAALWTAVTGLTGVEDWLHSTLSTASAEDGGGKEEEASSRAVPPGYAEAFAVGFMKRGWTHPAVVCLMTRGDIR